MADHAPPTPPTPEECAINPCLTGCPIVAVVTPCTVICNGSFECPVLLGNYSRTEVSCWGSQGIFTIDLVNNTFLISDDIVPTAFGTQAIRLYNTNNVTNKVYQLINNLIVGETISISFYHAANNQPYKDVHVYMGQEDFSTPAYADLSPTLLGISTAPSSNQPLSAWTLTTLSFTVPPGNSNFALIFADLGTGLPSNYIDNVTITLPAPIVIASAISPVSLGGTINLLSSLGASYLWSGPDSFSSTVQNPVILNATAAMDGTYTVIVTTDRGCTGTASTNIGILPCDISITASSNSPITIGNNLILTSTPSTNATAPFVYSWIHHLDGPISLDEDPTPFLITTLLQGGLYTVTLTDANGCVDTADVTVTVCPIISVASSNSGVALNGTINLFATFIVGATYTWSGPNGFTSTLQNPTILNATAAMQGVYTLITGGLGAHGRCPDESLTFVDILPCTLFITATSDSPAIIGNIVNLASIPLNGIGVLTYSWSGPNSFGSISQNPFFVVTSLLDEGTYIVTVTDATTGCIATAITYVDIIPCTIVITASSNSPITLGNPINLSSTRTNGTAPFTYSWIGPNGPVSLLEDPIISPATLLDAGLYTVTVIDTNGCIAIAHTTIIICDISITASSNRVGNTINLLATNPIGGTAPFTYSWSGPLGYTSPNQNDSFPVTTVLETGDYIITVIDALGCIAQSTIYVEIIPCYLITDCNPDGQLPFTTSFDLSIYDGKTIRFCIGVITVAPWPIDCYCATVTKTVDCDITIDWTDSEITSNFTECCLCPVYCYLLTDCADPSNIILVSNNFSAYVGKIIKLEGCNTCWMVAQSQDCANSVIGDPIATVSTGDEIIELIFNTCNQCNPIVIPIPLEILKLRTVKPGYNTPGCSPEYTEKISCNFAEAVFEQMSIIKYGIDICCDFDIDKLDIQKQQLDLKAIFDPKVCETICPPVICTDNCDCPIGQICVAGTCIDI